MQELIKTSFNKKYNDFQALRAKNIIRYIVCLYFPKILF